MFKLLTLEKNSRRFEGERSLTLAEKNVITKKII